MKSGTLFLFALLIVGLGTSRRPEPTPTPTAPEPGSAEDFLDELRLHRVQSEEERLAQVRDRPAIAGSMLGGICGHVTGFRMVYDDSSGKRKAWAWLMTDCAHPTLKPL